MEEVASDRLGAIVDDQMKKASVKKLAEVARESEWYAEEKKDEDEEHPWITLLDNADLVKEYLLHLVMEEF